MKTIKKLLFIIAIFLYSTGSYATEISSIQLTQIEQEWIKGNPLITLGADTFWPPMDFKDNQGNHTGFDADILKLICLKIPGLNIRVVQEKWGDVQALAKNGEINGLIGAAINKERTEYLNFSKPYLQIPSIIFTNNDSPIIASLEQLKGKRVAIKESAAFFKKLEKDYPDIILVPVESTQNALFKTSIGEVDYGFGVLSEVTHLVDSNFIKNIKIAFSINDASSEYHIALKKDQKILLEIINKAIDSIPNDAIEILKNNWMTLNDSEQSLTNLTKTELAYLQAKKEFTIGVLSNINPLSFYKDDQFQGIAPEIMSIIVQHLGITPTYVKFDSIGAMKMAFAKGELDILSLINYNTEIKSKALVTSPYIKSPLVIVTDESIAFTQNMDSLNNKKITTVKNSTHTNILKTRHPMFDVIEVLNPAEGIQKVMDGEVYAFIGSWLSVGSLLQKKPGARFHVSGITPYTVSFSIGVQKKQHYLHSSIQKALNVIPKSTKEKIIDKWTLVTIEQNLSYVLITKIVTIFLGIVAILLLWVITLSRKVKKSMAEYNDIMSQKVEQDMILMRKSRSTEFGDMFVSAKHQWVQPLNVISIECQNILESFSPIEIKATSLAQEIIESALIIEKQIKQMDSTIEDFREVYSGNSETKQFMISELLSELSRLYTPVLIAHTIHLETETKTDVSLIAKPTELKHALLIILNNAKEVLIDKGSDHRIISIIADTKGAEVIITIEDNGTGIPEELLPEKLFETFISSSEQSSSGIGLTVCKKIITESFNGTVSAENTPTGAKFTIRFPIED